MSYLNHRKILLALLTVVFSICCFFAVQLIYAYAEETETKTLPTSLTEDVSNDTYAYIVSTDSTVYLNGYSLAGSSITIASDATLTVYAGSTTSTGYITLGSGTLSGGFTLSSDETAVTVECNTLTVSADSTIYLNSNTFTGETLSIASGATLTVYAGSTTSTGNSISISSGCAISGGFTLSSNETAVTVSADTLTVSADSTIYLNGNILAIESSLSIAEATTSAAASTDSITLTIYAGSAVSTSYFTLTEGAISGNFEFSEDSNYLTISGDSLTAEGTAELYGTIDVTTFTMSSGELYVSNTVSTLNSGYALTASFLYVQGGSAVMSGSNSDYDVYLTGTFSYDAGSFYTPQGINATPADLINYSLGLKTDEAAVGNQKVFTAVSKVYIDGKDYNIEISSTTNHTESNYISVYIAPNKSHSISVIDGDGVWATYNLTYLSGQSTFTLSSEVATLYIDLSDGDVYIYSQYYVQLGVQTWWGGQYNFKTSGATANNIYITSDNDLTLSFTGGGTYSGTIYLDDESDTADTPVFTLIFDDNSYTFGSSSAAAINITGGSVVVGEEASSTHEVTASTYSNVKIGGIYAENAAVTVNGGVITGGGYAIQAVNSAVTINGGCITGNTADYGAIYVSSGSTLTLNGGNIYGNTGTYAGAIYASGSTLYLNGGVIADNVCTATGGSAVICSNSDCTVNGAFIYGNSNDMGASCYDIYGSSGSSVEIISGIISSYSGAEFSSDTVQYTVSLSDLTLSSISFYDISYDFTDISLSVSSLTIYGDSGCEDSLLTITDSGSTTYTYALFRSTSGTETEGFAAAQLATSATEISTADKYYLDSTGTYSLITVKADSTLYLDNAAITTLTVESGVTVNIYIINSNTIYTLSGSGSAVIDGSGSVTLSTAVSISSLTVNGGIVDFNSITPSNTITVNGGAYLNTTTNNVTAKNSDGDTLSLLTISFTEMAVTSVTVDGTDYGVSGTMSTLSLFVTAASHTVIVSVGERSYNYTVSYNEGFSSTASDGGLGYDLNSGSVSITSSGYTVDGATTSFSGSYTIYGTADANTIAVTGGTTIYLSGVTGSTLTISGGTVSIYLTDGTTNTFNSITVAEGATLNIYCSVSSGTAYLCATSFTIEGTVNIYGGVVEVPAIAVSGALNIKGGEVNNATIFSISGVAAISGGLVENSAITVTGALNVTGGTVSDSNISIIVDENDSSKIGALNVTGGSIEDTPVSLYGTAEISGGTITGGIAVDDGTLTVTGGVITYASGEGTIVITGGYVYGKLSGVQASANTESDSIYLIEIALPQTLDISSLGTVTITIPSTDGGSDTTTSYTLNQSYYTDTLYIYGGNYSSGTIECSFTYSDTTYIYTLKFDDSSKMYALADSITLDISEESYELCEDYYSVYGSENTRYVSSGSYTIINGGTAKTLYTYGAVTIYFNNVTEMGEIIAQDGTQGSLTISGTAEFTGGISTASSGTVYIASGTFVAAYVGSNVVVQGGSLTVDGNITSDGSVTVEGGELTVEGVEGSLTVTGGYVVINGKVSASKVTINGGSVTAVFDGTPQNSTGNSLYLFTPDITSYIQGEIYSVMVDSVEYNISGSYTEIYLYLTAQSHIVSIESEDAYLVYNLVYSSGSFTDYSGGILDISEGSVLIESDGYTVGEGEDAVKTYYTGDYVFLQSAEDETTNTITVSGASVTLYLYGIAIYAETDYAIYIIDGAQVSIILPDDTGNIAAALKASIYVDSTSALTMACAHAEESGHDDCTDCGLLYAAYESRIFYVEGTLNINGGNYVGGYADEGGAIYVDGGTVNIGNAIFYYNSADYGGTVYIAGGTVNMYGGYMLYNYASLGGAVYVESGKFNLSGGSLQLNEAYYGGAVYVGGGTFTLASGWLYYNTAYYSGGAAYIEGGASAVIYGGGIALNSAEEYGSAIYSAGSLRIYGGTITEENIIYSELDSQTVISGGISSIYAVGSLKVAGGSVNVLYGEVSDGENTLYCLDISLSGLSSLEIDGSAFSFDMSVADGATQPEYLYIWLDSSSHLIKQVTSSGTAYYIAVCNGAGFTLHTATELTVPAETTLSTAGYYYINVTADSLALTISADVTAFITGNALSSLTVNASTIANVYGLDVYEISAITVYGVLILDGVTAASAAVGTSESGATLKITDAQITSITLNGSSKLILGGGEIYISAITISQTSTISVSGSPVLTGVITLTSSYSTLFADSSAAAYAKYFAYDSTYTLLTESSGLRLVALNNVYTLTINITGNGYVTIDGTEYSNGATVTLAGGVSYDISYTPDDYCYLSSAILSGDVSESATISISANSTLTVNFAACAVAVYSSSGSTYIGAYSTLAAAISSGATYIQLLDDNTENITLTSDITLDLNGYTATVTVDSDAALTVTGTGSLTVTTNRGTLTVNGGNVTVTTNSGTIISYGGIITVTTNNGTIISYGGAFTSDTLTVTDGFDNTLTAVSFNLPVNTYAVYVDGEDYGITYSGTEEKTVYLYLSSYSQYIVANVANSYSIYSISISENKTTENDDITVYDISQRFIYITSAGTYYVLQTGSNSYGISVAAGAEDSVALLGTADAEIIVNSGTVNIQGSFEGDITVNGGTVTLTGAVTGDMVVYGGAVTITGTLGGGLTVNGGTVTISGVVSGSAYVYGGTLELSGSISGNLYVMGGTVTVTDSAAVYKYLHLTSGTLTVNSDATLTASSGVMVNSNGTATLYGTLSGAVTVNGGTAQLNGTVSGTIKVNSGTVTINGIIKSALYVYSGGTVTIDSGIFYSTVYVYKGGAITINGGLFVGRVTLFNGASYNVNGGAFANAISSSIFILSTSTVITLYEVDIANYTAVTKLELDGKEYNVSLTLNSTLYLAGGYSFTIYISENSSKVVSYTEAASSSTPDSSDATEITSESSSYITAGGSYVINGFTGTLTISVAYTESANNVNLYLKGCSLDNIIIAINSTTTTVNNCTVNIYVLEGTNTVGSISNNDSNVTLNILAYGGALIVSGTLDADSISMNGGMVVANYFSGAKPYSSSATLAVIDVSDITYTAITYVWIKGADSVYGYSLNISGLTTLYLWYTGSLDESYSYTATVIYTYSETSYSTTIDLCYSSDSGILANALTDAAFEDVFSTSGTTVTVNYGNTWTVDTTDYTVQYYVDGEWSDTAPTAVGTYAVRLAYTVTVISTYTVYTANDGWTVTISPVTITISWNNLNSLYGSTSIVYYDNNIELTLTYYDYFTGEQLSGAPTAAGVYLIVASYDVDGYVLENAEVIYVIGNYTLSNSADYTVYTEDCSYTIENGTYVYLTGSVCYIIGGSYSYTAVYDESTESYILFELGTFDISYGSLEITATGFTYCGLTYTGYSGEYMLTGEDDTATVTVSSGCVAYIYLDNCTLYSIDGDGVIMLTVNSGLSYVQSVSASQVVVADGGALSGDLGDLYVTNSDGTILYACEIELGGTYAVTNIKIDSTSTTVEFTASSFILYLTAAEHTVVITTEDGTEITFNITYSEGFTCLKQNSLTGSYVFTVDGEELSGTSITEGKSYTVSGYTAAYGEVQYLFSTSADSGYTSTVPTAAGAYYVKAYVPAGGGYSEIYGTAQKFTITAAGKEQTYIITLIGINGEVNTETLTKGSTLFNINNIKATAPDGFTFAGWEYADGTILNGTDTLTGDITLYAVFRASVTLEIDGSGTVTVNGTSYTSGTSLTIYYGTEYTITAAANSGYVAHLVIDGTAAEGSTYTFTAGSGTVETISVTFDTNGVSVYAGTSVSGYSLGLYGTIAEALEAADGYSRVYIVLFTDVSGAAEITGNVTVNLNGHTWSNADITVTGSLTIKNTAETASSASYRLAAKLAAAEVDGGEIDGTVTVDGGTVTVSGGTISSLVISSGEAYVNSGTVTAAVVAEGATLDISGGNVISVISAGSVVSGTEQLYSLVIPVSIDVTSVTVYYSTGASKSYDATAVDGYVYLWLSSTATSVTFNYGAANAETHAFTYKNGAFTLTNTWLDTTTLTSVLNGIADIAINYLETPLDDTTLSTVQSRYGTVVLQYSADGEVWSSSYPSSAGSYYARLYVAAGANYTELASDSRNITINRNTVADSSLFTFTPAQSLIYDGTAKAAEVEPNVNVEGLVLTVYYSTDGGTSWTADSPIAAGTYLVAIYITETGSIAEGWVKDSSWTFTIAPQTVSNPEADGTVFTYSGSAQTYYIQSSSLYTVTNSTRIEAGTYTVTVTLYDKNNYVWADDSDGDGVITYTFVISPYTIETPAADGASYSYTGSLINYTIAASDYYTVSGNSQKNAGTYTVTVSLTDKTNYCWSDGTTADLTFEFVIAKASANIQADDITVTYGDEITVNWTADSTATDATIVYYLNGIVCGDITAAGTYTAVITLAETDNYLGGSLEITITVNKIAQSDSAAATVEQGATEDLKKGATYVISIEGLTYYDGTITYTSSDESVATVSEDGTVTIVGSGTYTITVTLSGDSRYADWSFTLEQVKVKYDFTWLFIVLAAVVVLALAGAGIYLLIYKKRKAGSTQAQENSDAIAQALAMYEADLALQTEAEVVPAAETAPETAEAAEVSAAEEMAEETAQDIAEDAAEPAEAEAVTQPAAETAQSAATAAEEQQEETEQPLTEEEVALLIDRYRENENLIRKMGWGGEA